ncbi:hypothetical protein IWX75_001465 [Arthrobacter sp. CAN_A6]|uniref:hypothetical protein n=1 Tax=Arthrobacter sp. CAN_A6 TaxID=2787721 RepID=UPI0018C90F6A
MREETKDKIEAGGAWALESVAAVVPVIGGPMAIAINKTLAAAESRRVQNQILELHQLLGDALESKRIGLDALEKDEFLANLHFVIRQLQETTEANKRARLKHALVVGAESKWMSQAERLTRIIARLEEPHILALCAFYDIAEAKFARVREGTLLVLKKLSTDGFNRSENYYKVLFEQLASEGLVVIDSPAELAAQLEKGRARRLAKGWSRDDESQQLQGSTLKLTGQGINFVRFLSKTDFDAANG